MDGASASASLDIYALIEPYVQELVGLLVVTATATVLAFLKQHLGVKVREENQQAILAAAERASRAALWRYRPELRRMMRVDIDHPAVREAAGYLEAQIPKRLKKMGMGAADVRSFVAKEIESRLEMEVPEPPKMTEDEIKRRLTSLLEQLSTIRKEPQ